MIGVLHVITGLSTGGAETSLYKLLSAIDRDRFDSRVVSLTGAGTIGPRIRELGLPLVCLGMRRGVPNPVSVWKLWRVIRHTRPDIIQTWLYHADLMGLIAGKLARVPCTAWNLRCSYMGADYYGGLSGLVVRILARLSSLPATVIVNSQTGRALHENLGYHPRRWSLIPNGFDLTSFRPSENARRELRGEMGVPPDAVLIGLVARFDAVKGHDTFLHAASHLADRHPNLHFVLVGDGCHTDNPALRKFLTPGSLGDKVHLLGERHDIARLTAGLDIANCSSIGEGFPNVVGEAMACGVPCVVTDVGDCAHIVGNPQLVIAANDDAALAEVWHRLIELGPAQRRALGAEARRRINEHYALPKIVRMYEDLYTELGVTP